jgi:hypothetical protein
MCSENMGGDGLRWRISPAGDNSTYYHLLTYSPWRKKGGYFTHCTYVLLHRISFPCVQYVRIFTPHPKNALLFSPSFPFFCLLGNLEAACLNETNTVINLCVWKPTVLVSLGQPHSVTICVSPTRVRVEPPPRRCVLGPVEAAPLRT